MIKQFVFSFLLFSWPLLALDLQLYSDRKVMAYQPKQEGANKTSGVEKKQEKEASSKEEGKILVQASVLYWKARVSDSMYAVSSQSRDFTLPYRSNLYEISLPFDPGLKVGAGYHSNHDSWTLDCLFTYFNTQKRVSTGSLPVGDLKNPTQFSSEVLNALLPGQSGALELYFQKAVSVYNLVFEDLALSLSKNYSSGQIAFIPEIALEAVYMKARQANTYSKGAVLGNNYLRVNRKNQFFGLGPEMKLTMRWGLLKHFSLEQSLLLSLLLGNLESDYKEKLSNSSSTFMRLSGRDHRLVPHIGSTLGASFDRPCNRFFSRIHAALLFEGQFFSNFNQKVSFGRDMDLQNLYLYGVTLNLGVDY